MNPPIRPTPDALETIDVDGVKFAFAEIHGVVDRFYTAVAQDPVLKVPFGSVSDWPHHIERLTHFWWIRLGGQPYQKGMYNPVEKHFLAGFNQEFLTRWLALFRETLESTLRPEQSAVWSEITEHMGQALLWKNEQYTEYRARADKP